jgi:hypothetical protein
MTICLRKRALNALVGIDILIVPVQIGANGRSSSQVVKFLFSNSFVGVSRAVEELNVDSLLLCIVADSGDI